MVIAARLPIHKISKCPHCGSSFVTYDILESEPYCCICGWRRAIRITEEQARNHFSCEKEFWLNLFAREDDPYDLS